MDTFEGYAPVKSNERIIAVYKLIHKASGKFYIGSSGDFYKRRINHISELRNNRHYVVGLQELYNESPHFFFHIVSIGTESPDVDIRDRAYDIEQELLDKHWGDPLLLNNSKNARHLELSQERELARIQKLKDTFQKPEVLRKITIINKKLRQTSEARSQQSKISKTLWQNKTHRKRMESVWKDPDYLRRQVENQPTSKPISLNGKNYPSISNAARALGISRIAVKKLLTTLAVPREVAEAEEQKAIGKSPY